MSSYAIRKTVKGSFDEVLARVTEGLTAEGFGVLTEVDVAATMKRRLGVDFRRYRILGACNPPFAHQALTEDLDLGVMMPCNVVVYEGDDGSVHVTAIDPGKTMGMLGMPKVAELGRQVAEKLGRVLAKL